MICSWELKTQRSLDAAAKLSSTITIKGCLRTQLQAHSVLCKILIM